MIVYRIKHIPSGLYFCPSRPVRIKIGANHRYVKTNLSKDGKFYMKPPSFHYIGDGFYNHFASIGDDTVSPFVESEWMIEEIP